MAQTQGLLSAMSNFQERRDGISSSQSRFVGVRPRQDDVDTHFQADYLFDFSAIPEEQTPRTPSVAAQLFEREVPPYEMERESLDLQMPPPVAARTRFEQVCSQS